MHVENKRITLTPDAFQLEAFYVLEKKTWIDFANNIPSLSISCNDGDTFDERKLVITY